MEILIRPARLEDTAILHEHMKRHLSESGGKHPHFLPFAPDSEELPTKPNLEAAIKGLDERNWRRWFIAVISNQAIGHVDLKGGGLAASMHRCELGIGIESQYRAQGLGRRLMETAISFARSSTQLSWVDLRVFAHNTAGIGLYRSLGFEQTGKCIDHFRIGGESIDDVSMSLAVG